MSAPAFRRVGKWLVLPKSVVRISDVVAAALLWETGAGDDYDGEIQLTLRTGPAVTFVTIDEGTWPSLQTALLETP